MAPLFTEAELAETRAPAPRGHPAPAARLRRRGRSPPGRPSTCSSAAGCASATRSRSPRAATSSRARSGARACCSSATTRAARTASSTSAATAAPASSPSPRARCAASSAPTTPGATASTAASRARPTPTRSRTSTRRPSGSSACAWRSATASCSPTSPAPPARSTTTSATSRQHLAHYRLGDLAARRRDHLRRRGQLEGDRRELLRVPALPGRAPRAQPPLALHERRRVRGRRRLVRRLDDAQRGRRDDGRRTAATGSARRSPG